MEKKKDTTWWCKMSFPYSIRFGEKKYIVKDGGEAGGYPIPGNYAIRYTMSYGDPDAIKYLGLTTEFLNPRSNFCHVDGWSQKEDWGAVTQFWSGVDRSFLMAIQPDDGISMNMKENWLINAQEDTFPARPLWVKDGILRCGHSVFGHNPVLLEADAFGNPVEYKILASYPTDRIKKEIVFYNAIGMPKSMIPIMLEEKKNGINLHKKYPYWIQRCSEAMWINGKDIIGWYPKGGEIWYVFWSKFDWTHNSGDNRMLLPKDCTTVEPNPNYPG